MDLRKMNASRLRLKISIILFLVICCFIVSQRVFAQQALVDSFTKILTTQLADSARAKAMVNLALYSEALDSKLAHGNYEKARLFASKKNLRYYEGLAYSYEAFLDNLEYKPEQEFFKLQKAISCFQKNDHYLASYRLGECYNGIAIYYESKGIHDKSVENCFKAINIIEKSNRKNRLAMPYINLAIAFEQMGLYKKQKQYLDSSLIKAKLSKRKDELFSSYLWQTGYYINSGQFKIAKVYVDTAKMYLSEQFDFIKVKTFYLYMACVNQNMGHYDVAVEIYKKVYELSKKNNYTWHTVEPFLQIGYIYTVQKKYDRARNYLNEGLAMAKKNKYTLFEREALESLSKLYALEGKYQLAYLDYKKFHILDDSIKSEKLKKSSVEFEKKYETEKKVNRIIQLEKDKHIQFITLKQEYTFNFMLLVSIAILLLVILLIYRNLKQKQLLHQADAKLNQNKINELEVEKKLMATESVLKGQDEERSRLAKDLHDGLGGMLSGIKYSFINMKENLIMTPDNHLAFEHSMDMLDSSMKEMRRVAHNMMPEALLRFGLDAALKDFCNEINKSNGLRVNYQSIGLEGATIDQTVSITIYRIVQELLNNTMKHSKANTAIVQLTKLDGQLSITVEDNGKGFDPSILNKSKGIGWINIQNRVDFLKGKLNITSKLGEGTSVLIEFN